MKNLSALYLPIFRYSHYSLIPTFLPLTSNLKPATPPVVRKNVLGLICLAITAGILLAGLWPFNFSPENKVRWLKDQNGVQFYGQAIVFSTLPVFALLTRNPELTTRNDLSSSTLPSVFPVSTRNTELVTRNNQFSSTLPSIHHSNIPVRSITIELSLQSTTESSPHLGHIFSFLDEHGSETFFVGQWRSHLLLGKGIHGKKNYR